MSFGLTPYDFVQQVFYAQEKVRLDFRPDDDKYKEVLMEANLVLQELQSNEDWTWLRRRLVLGSVDDEPGCSRRHDSIPEFQLPEWVYKVSTLHDDCVKLHHVNRSRCRNMMQECCCCDPGTSDCIDEWRFIEVPYASTGRLNGRNSRQYLGPATNVPELGLRAITVGDNILTFNRPLTYEERHHRVAVCDVQERLPLLHICDKDCPRDADGKCTLIEDRVFTQIPDPNYMVFRTAALHAEGSPPAQGRIQSLSDTAQKLLSAMRQNDASATDADFIDWDAPGFLNVV